MPSTLHAVTAAERRQHVAARYLKGAQQTELARDFGVSQAQISLDLTAIRKEWLASTLRDFDAAKSEQLAKIDVIETEAWQAWERSKEPREVTMTEQSEGASATRKASVRREGQAGDPRFLERIQKCIEQRCAILGLNTAQDPTTVVNVNVLVESLSGALARAYGHSENLTPRATALPRPDGTGG